MPLKFKVQGSGLGYLRMKTALRMPLCFCVQNNIWGVKQKA